VTLRAVMQRINRKLAASGQKLKTARSPRTEQSVGRFFVVDEDRNWIVEQRVDPEALARRLEVLAQWEEVDSE
jgi:hypothetical protein